MKMSRLISVLFTSVFLIASQLVTAQCSMCRAVVESDISGKGSGINNGIVYLMAFPYALVVLLAFGLVYKMRKDDKKQDLI
jgi:hypothetical protein